jgi:hypothetical protein
MCVHLLKPSATSNCELESNFNIPELQHDLQLGSSQFLTFPHTFLALLAGSCNSNLTVNGVPKVLIPSSQSSHVPLRTHLGYNGQIIPRMV